MLRRPWTAMIGALTCLAALVATGLVSHVLPAGEALDGRALDAFTRVREHDVDGILERLVHLGDPLPYVLMAAAVVVAAVGRERNRLAVIVGVVLVASPVSAELIKLATATARHHSTHFANHISSASWPSGHATGAMTLALCAVLVSPPRLRPVVAIVGAAFSLAVGYAVIALVWHFPSDTIGAFLLSAAWAMGAVAASRRWPDTVEDARRRSLGTGPVLGLAAAVGFGALALSTHRSGPLLDRATAHLELFVAAASIAGLAGLLAVALARSARS